MAARWRDTTRHARRDEHGDLPGPGHGYVGGGDFSNSGAGGHNPADRHPRSDEDEREDGERP